MRINAHVNIYIYIYIYIQIIIMRTRCGKYVGRQLWKICGKDLSELEVALVCFLGHRSNPNLMDWSSGFDDLHDFWIFGNRGNPYLWIRGSIDPMDGRTRTRMMESRWRMDSKRWTQTFGNNLSVDYLCFPN